MEQPLTSLYNSFMLYRFKLPIILVTIIALPFMENFACMAETGLTLPRFASIRASKVHLRAGPGIRYPVDWIFVRRGQPVEITAEFKDWRKVRDWQGTEGWVHRSMLSGRRTVVIKGGIQPLRREAHQESPLTARVMEKEIGRVIKCEQNWCKLELGKIRGWMQKIHLWGTYQAEKLN